MAVQAQYTRTRDIALKLKAIASPRRRRSCVAGAVAEVSMPEC